jgi:hypothetical protein
MGQDPVTGDYDDVELFEIMIRVNLDAFWERASSTVGSNLRAGMRSEKTTGRLNMPSLTPPMVPFPLKDLLGMSVTIAVLDRSLDPGNYDNFAQWKPLDVQGPVLPTSHRLESLGWVNPWERSNVVRCGFCKL